MGALPMIITGRRRYSHRVANLRDRYGRPALKTRVVAAAVLLGLLTLSAPVLIPLLRWIIALITP